MKSLLRYTLDLFEAPAPVDSAYQAPETVAKSTFQHPRADRQVRLGQTTVGYRFQRARRRTIGFAVGPDGLVVRAPRWTPLYEVEAALQEKAVWIVRKLEEMQERQARQDGLRLEWRDGTNLPFLGELVALQLDPAHVFVGAGAQLSATAADGQRTLKVGLALTAEPHQIRDAVQAWLMRQAKDNFQQRLNHFAPQLQVQWKKLSLSSAHTRWGSAKVDGSIRLNWRLVHFAQDVIDYVVVHELSHLRVMNHSPQFWETVRSVVPDYAHQRKQLKDDALPRW
jgi:predicted metal-dependent hydrolase